MLTTRLQLHPASLSGKLHRAIQMKSVQQSTKQVKVRTTAAAVDKNRQEEAKMRELHRSRCSTCLRHDVSVHAYIVLSTGSSSNASKSGNGASTAGLQGAFT